MHQAKHVQFNLTQNIHTIKDPNVVMIKYDSGADGNYLSERDRMKAGLPILRQSSKRVMVANGDTANGKAVTRLPFPTLSDQARSADTFHDFPNSLMSVT